MAKSNKSRRSSKLANQTRKTVSSTQSPRRVVARPKQAPLTAGIEVAKSIILLVQSLADKIHSNQKANGKLGFLANTKISNTEDWIGENVPETEFQQRLHLIKQLCKFSRTLFFNESRVVKVSGPTNVFGDIHGNLSDLLHYSRLFWPRMPSMLSTNIVFLGDYVDRGLQSLEVFLYIIAFKILNPIKVTVLRGNHETRGTQISFGFRIECLEKFGDVVGSEVWELINDVMDCIPVCGVINESIFVAHGGIPASTTSIRALQAMPRIMTEPEKEFPAAHEILWNDPADRRDMIDANRRFGTLSFFQGFVSNPKRGTAYLYSEQAVDNFLRENNLTHIIRAHEKNELGFAFHFNGKVCTVFSSSFYDYKSLQSNERTVPNWAGVIRVQDNVMTPIQITTEGHLVKTSEESLESTVSTGSTSLSASNRSKKKQQVIRRRR